MILQNLLLRSPFVKPIDTTGIYDNNTAHAVASYQNGNHLRRYSNNLGGGGGGAPDIFLGGGGRPGPGGGGGGVLDESLGGEVRLSPSYPDPV